MVDVLPEKQGGEDGVVGVYHAVAVAAIDGLIILGERSEAIWIIRAWLRREVAEDFSAVVNRAVAVAVEREKGVVGVGGYLTEKLGHAVVIKVKVNAALRVG